MNQTIINNLSWNGKNQIIPLGDGLYINVREHSSTYLIRRKKGKKTTVKTLGKSHLMKYKDARMALLEFLNESNPTNTTVETLCDEYLEIVAQHQKSAKQVEGYLNSIKSEFGHRRAGDTTTLMLSSYIRHYSKERGGRSADRLRSYLKQIFSFGIELGYLSTNPMANVTKRITGYKGLPRDRVLTDDEIKMIWQWKSKAIGRDQTAENKQVLQFLLLTGLRISEALNGYIDGDLFRVDDTKGKHDKNESRPHWVYLTPTARSLLPLPDCTTTNIQHWLKRKLDNAHYKEGERFTPHDLRRTFVTRLNEAGSPIQIIEKAVNHKMEGMLAVYNRAEYTDERIDVFKHMETLILDITGKNHDFLE